MGLNKTAQLLRCLCLYFLDAAEPYGIKPFPSNFGMINTPP